MTVLRPFRFEIKVLIHLPERSLKEREETGMERGGEGGRERGGEGRGGGGDRGGGGGRLDFIFCEVEAKEVWELLCRGKQ